MASSLKAPRKTLSWEEGWGVYGRGAPRTAEQPGVLSHQGGLVSVLVSGHSYEKLGWLLHL